jgi:hypothetical protein
LGDTQAPGLRQTDSAAITPTDHVGADKAHLILGCPILFTLSINLNISHFHNLYGPFSPSFPSTVLFQNWPFTLGIILSSTMKNLNESWEAYKPEITRLYMAEGKSKKKVMQIMESTHGFVASYVTLIFNMFWMAS